MTTFAEHTDKLVAKIGDPIMAGFFEQQQYAGGRGEYPSVPLSFQDSVVFATAVIADNYPGTDRETIPTPEEELQYYQDWRQYLRQRCSERFAALADPERNIVEGLDREALNRNPELLRLNALRLGIGMKIHWMHNRKNRIQPAVPPIAA